MTVLRIAASRSASVGLVVNLVTGIADYRFDCGRTSAVYPRRGILGKPNMAVAADTTDHRKIECSNDGDRPRPSSIRPDMFEACLKRQWRERTSAHRQPLLGPLGALPRSSKPAAVVHPNSASTKQAASISDPLPRCRGNILASPFGEGPASTVTTAESNEVSRRRVCCRFMDALSTPHNL